jgi:hypothetical protein
MNEGAGIRTPNKTSDLTILAINRHKYIIKYVLNFLSKKVLNPKINYSFAKFNITTVSKLPILALK